jgi:hypothetical protein
MLLNNRGRIILITTQKAGMRLRIFQWSRASLSVSDPRQELIIEAQEIAREFHNPNGSLNPANPDARKNIILTSYSTFAVRTLSNKASEPQKDRLPTEEDILSTYTTTETKASASNKDQKSLTSNIYSIFDGFFDRVIIDKGHTIKNI